MLPYEIILTLKDVFAINAELIAVGAENYQSFFEASSQYLSGELGALGVSCSGYIQAGTSSDQLFAIVRDSARQNSVVVLLCSPEAASAATVANVLSQGLGLILRQDTQSAAMVRAYAAKTGKVLTETDITAFSTFPQGAVPLYNHSGLIQGYAISAKKQLMLVMPSTPSELATTFSGKVRELFEPYRIQTAPQQGGAAVATAHAATAVSAHVSTAQRILRAAQLGEELIPKLLQPLAGHKNPRIRLRGNRGDYEILVETIGSTKNEAEAICQDAVDQIRRLLGVYLYSENDQPMERAARDELLRHNMTIAVAESGTGGHLAQLLTKADPTGRLVQYAVIAANHQAKHEKLGISEKFLSSCGGVSRQTAAAMALGACKQGQTKLGLAITGTLEEKSGARSKIKPGTIHVALTDGEHVWVRTMQLDAGSDKEDMRSLAVLQAMNMARLYGLHYPQVMPGGMTPQEATTSGGQKQSFMAGILPTNKSKGSTGSAVAVRKKETETMNLFQKIRAGKLDKNDWIRIGVLALCVVVFIGCLVYIGSVYMESHTNAKLNEDLTSLFEKEVDPDEVEGYPAGYLAKFASLYAQNQDVAGWIKIENTKVNYVVVQTDNNEFYERRDFSKADNQHGVPFVDFRVAQREPSTNTVIYAHNMNDGQMFGELLNYKSLAYYREHPLISYDSVYYEGQYKIFGVVVCKKDDPDFSYHNFIEPNTDAEMKEFVGKVRERSILNTKVDVVPGDKLLTLSTCDYTFKSNTGDRIARFVVFARKVRDGESTQVDTAGATINTNPVMPQEWYDKLAKDQEAERAQQAAQEAAAALEKWLTEDEKANLSAEEKKLIAERRQADAKKYLTYDEQEDGYLNLKEKIYLIDERKTDFALLLYSDEQGLSLNKRINLAAERKDEALKYLTSSELYSLGSYDKVLKAIEEKKAASQSYAKWLTASEIASMSDSQKQSLMAQRKKQAQDAGLTEAEIAAAKDWAEIQQLIATKGEKTQFVAANAPYLNSSESSKTLTELKALVSERKAIAAEAGLTEAEIKACKNWDALKKVIDNKTAAQKADFIAANTPYLNSSESSKSLSDLKVLVNERKAQTTAVGLTEAEIKACKNWDALQAAIKTKVEQANAAAAAEKAAKDAFLADRYKMKFISIDTAAATSKQLEENFKKNEAYALSKLTSDEIASCSSWTQIQKLIKDKEAASSSSSSQSSSSSSSSSPSSSSTPPSSSSSSSSSSEAPPPSSSSSGSSSGSSSNGGTSSNEPSADSTSQNSSST